MQLPVGVRLQGNCSALAVPLPSSSFPGAHRKASAHTCLVVGERAGQGLCSPPDSGAARRRGRGRPLGGVQSVGGYAICGCGAAPRQPCSCVSMLPIVGAQGDCLGLDPCRHEHSQVAAAETQVRYNCYSPSTSEERTNLIFRLACEQEQMQSASEKGIAHLISRTGAPHLSQIQNGCIFALKCWAGPCTAPRGST